VCRFKSTLGVKTYWGYDKDDWKKGFAKMNCEGHVEKGVVVLENGATLPEGARARVETIETHEISTASPSEPLGKALQQFSGIAEDLPADMAENHDHYLHGRPIR